jgi:hypothetical protein
VLSTVGNYAVFSQAYLAAFSRTLYCDRYSTGGERSDGEVATKSEVQKEQKKVKTLLFRLNFK